MSNSEPIIKTTLQLKICVAMLKLTEIKRNLDCDGWFYKTELVDLVKAKYTTIDSYLQGLKKKGMVKHLKHFTKPDYEGGIYHTF
ncbi:MAG: hypothetical protein QMD36_06715 [Candidatus Aenigmarchaeota archaeon]|nr:hypothetical protein [Candidatus Aenigmarchaeota archaeon]